MSEQLTAEQQIDAFWQMLENCFEIEPREYFEQEAPRNGFGSPLAMACFYMWKRDANVEEATRRERERCAGIANEYSRTSNGAAPSYYIAELITAAIRDTSL